MKNQYFGDVNDYRKYGLLRCFAHAGLRVGLCWMLTPDDASPDGGKTGYLRSPHVWRAFDAPLFDCLAVWLSHGRRSIQHFEASGLLPRALYFSDLLLDSVAAREQYFHRVTTALNGADVLFFDPDKGLEVRSVRVGNAGSSRYLYWSELERAWKTGASLIVFQHYSRESRRRFADRLLEQLRRRTSAPLLFGLHSAHVLFLVAAHARHESRIEKAASLIDRRWPGELTLIGQVAA